MNYLKGGFIGVDIFFVISGYLITSIIFKDLYFNNSFSFKYFYERRIRRILPVLLLVILTSFIFAWFFLLPGNFIDFSKVVSLFIGI
jgi:peptidoglycan/LPS O-acetylase OafA/YrhL